MSHPTHATTSGFLCLLRIFLRLGLTSFGGPVAHIGFFRQEFVHKRRWFSDSEYSDLVALCHFLPGPSSSQVGMALGLSQAGYRGALAAWLGFTLPSALLMAGFGLLLGQGTLLPPALVQGLKIAALAVVAQALWAMQQSLCPDRARLLLMAACAAAALHLPAAWMQPGLIVLAALAGMAFCRDAPVTATVAPQRDWVTPRQAQYFALAALLLLSGLPLLRQLLDWHWLTQADIFSRASALVFGGGHVVLPLLQNELVDSQLIPVNEFLSGYAAAQTIPGPLFTFAAYIGALDTGLVGALICLLAMFLPAFLLLAAALPWWQRLRAQPQALAALRGVNAGVVGLLLAALYDPLWRHSIQSVSDASLALWALMALAVLRWPVWLVVPGCGLLTWLLTL